MAKSLETRKSAGWMSTGDVLDKYVVDDRNLQRGGVIVSARGRIGLKWGAGDDKGRTHGKLLSKNANPSRLLLVFRRSLLSEAEQDRQFQSVGG